ncbi:mCG1037156, partial [Mus musculus]
VEENNTRPEHSSFASSSQMHPIIPWMKIWKRQEWGAMSVQTRHSVIPSAPLKTHSTIISVPWYESESLPLHPRPSVQPSSFCPCHWQCLPVLHFPAQP